MKKRSISLLLSITVLLSTVTALFSVPVSAASASEALTGAAASGCVGLSARQENIVNRAYALYDCTWTAARNVNGWRDQSTFYAGSTYRLPYGQPATTGRYIGYGVSFPDFLAATRDSNSIFYTQRSNYAGKYSTYYATDCSGFVSYCWGVGRNTTATLPNISANLGKATVSNIRNNLQVGDALNYSSSHVVLVTGIGYENGSMSAIEITEQTPPQLKKSQYTPEGLAAKYGGSYSILRYSGSVANPIFTLQFDANGGSGSMNNTPIGWGTASNIPPNSFTRANYKFKGWNAYRAATNQWAYTNGSSTGWYQSGSQPSGYSLKVYGDKAGISKLGLGVSDTVKLKAVWEKNAKTYTLTFDANGGKGTMSNQVMTYGTSTKIKANAFTKDGYDFRGWTAYREASKKWRYTNGDKTDWYASGSEPTGYYLARLSDKKAVSDLGLGTGDTVKLKAVWGGANYKVNYDANGGTGTMSPTSHERGVQKVLRDNAFTKSGNTFAGWHLTRESDGKSAYSLTGDNEGVKWYIPGTQPDGYSLALYPDQAAVSSLSNTENDVITVKAHWKPKTDGTQKYYFDFDANGGTGSMTRQTIVFGENTKIKKNTFTRAGYKFAGWKCYRERSNKWRMKDADGNTKWCVYAEKDAKDSFSVYKDQKSVATTVSVDAEVVTMYAVWEEDFKFTFVFDANGGTGTMPDQTVTYGVDTKINANQFTKEGYIFAGWNLYKKSANGWYYTNGTDSGYYELDKQPSGYYLGVYGDKKTVSKTGSKYDDVVTLKAVWSKAKYTVHYDANGGKGTMSDSSHYNGVTKRLSANAYTKSGNTFAGWILSRASDGKTMYILDGTKKWYKPGSQPEGYALAHYSDKAKFSSLSSVNGDVITASAVWQPDTTSTQTYYFDYIANGGVGTMSRSSVIYGEKTKISKCTFTRSGYKFQGWFGYRAATDTWRFLDKDGKAKWCKFSEREIGDTLALYRDNQNVAKSSKNDGEIITLYASWSDDRKFTFVFDANGGTGTMDNQLVLYGIDTPINKNTFTREGYTFAGWNVYQQATNRWHYTNGKESGFYEQGKQPEGYNELAVYDDEKTVSKTGTGYDDVVKLYAVWKANTDLSYTVHYYIKGTTIKLIEDKTVGSMTFNSTATEKAPTVLGYVPTSGSQTVTLDAYNKEITFEYSLLIGDVDRDGEITVNDATAIQKYLAELKSLGADSTAAADVNADGRIDVKDASQIQKILAKMLN